MKVLDSHCHRFLRKVIPDHLQSCATLLDCWWLTDIFILSTRLQNCNADYYVTNLIPKLVKDATSLMPDGFIFQQDGAPAHRACNARLVTSHCNDYCQAYQTRQILICLIIMCGVPCWKPTTSWISQAWQVSHQQLRSFKQDWRWSGMTFLINLW